MDLRRLRYFVTVAEEGHFGRAAERLYIAQPAVSQQIRALEEELGFPLFDRTTRRVELTPAGAKLVPRIRAMLTETDAAVAEARRVHDGAAGLLRLGFIGSATYGLMPQMARSLQADVPDLRLDLRGEMLSPEIIDSLLDGRIDVGVLRPRSLRPRLETRPLRSESLLVAVPSDHRLASATTVLLSDLADEPWISWPRHGSAMASVIAEMTSRAGFTPSIRSEVAESSTLVSFVAAGLGVALVPEGLRALRLPGVIYLPLEGETPEVDLVVAWRCDIAPGLLNRALTHLDRLLT